jgi:hypothetical protein
VQWPKNRCFTVTIRPYTYTRRTSNIVAQVHEGVFRHTSIRNAAMEGYEETIKNVTDEPSDIGNRSGSSKPS